MAKIKGMLFTLVLTILATIVLSFAIISFHNVEKSRIQMAELSSIDRLYNLDNSIQTGFSKIFHNKSGISVSINETTVTFEERLPNQNPTFNNKITSYEDYIESNYENIEIDTSSLINELPLVIMPHNITFSHNIQRNRIYVKPTTINIEGYKVLFEDQRICNVIDTPNPEGLLLEVPQCSYSENVDSAYITTGGSFETTVTLVDNELTVSYAVANPVAPPSSFKVKVMIDKTQEQVTVNYPEDPINITFKELNMSRTGGARIV